MTPVTLSDISRIINYARTLMSNEDTKEMGDRIDRMATRFCELADVKIAERKEMADILKRETEFRARY